MPGKGKGVWILNRAKLKEKNVYKKINNIELRKNKELSEVTANHKTSKLLRMNQ